MVSFIHNPLSKSECVQTVSDRATVVLGQKLWQGKEEIFIFFLTWPQSRACCASQPPGKKSSPDTRQQSGRNAQHSGKGEGCWTLGAKKENYLRKIIQIKIKLNDEEEEVEDEIIDESCKSQIKREFLAKKKRKRE